nr:MAG TPA: hypothetical protein [Caudoviricetes sp.]
MIINLSVNAIRSIRDTISKRYFLILVFGLLVLI